MSNVAAQLERKGSPGDPGSRPLDPAVGPSWLPRDFWPVAVDHLVTGQDYFLLLGEDFQLLQANDAFRDDISSTFEQSPLHFSDTLTPGSTRELASIATRRDRAPFKLELMHLVRGGIRSVLYHFRFHENRWIAIGRDQSDQLELVSQMATLVNDLEVRVDFEKERSELLKKLSERDPLTGLWNRREFERVFESHRRLHREMGSNFSIISIDIDRFKQVNDVHGHPMGDEVLKRVATLLEDSLRDGDCVARMGGEEFMVIARGTTLEHAVELGDRLRQRVADTPMPEPLRQVTISVGVASTRPNAPGDPPDERDLVQLADSALYAAKRDGRNCVRFAE